MYFMDEAYIVKKCKEGFGKNCKVVLRIFDEYLREILNEFEKS